MYHNALNAYRNTELLSDLDSIGPIMYSEQWFGFQTVVSIQIQNSQLALI